MPRKAGAPPERAAGRAKRIARTPNVVAPATAGDRAESLEALSNHCAAALRIAEVLGEKLLVYLLGMAELESAHAVRRHMGAVAAAANQANGVAEPTDRPASDQD